MKKVLLFVLGTVGLFAQVSNDRLTIIRKDTAGIYSVQLASRTYTSATKDTSIWYATSDFKNHFLTVQSRDSARCHIKYQLSVDMIAVGVLTTKDSLSTVTATGDLKTVDVSGQILGAPYVRYVFDFTVSGVPQGKTTNTYDAILTRKQD